MLPEGPDAGTVQGVALTLAPRPLLSSVSEQGSQIPLCPGQCCPSSQTYQPAGGGGLCSVARPRL